MGLHAGAVTSPTQPSIDLEWDRLEAWSTDPFVKQTLQSADFAALVSELRAFGRFLAVYPDPTGTYVSYWEGRVPEDAPSHSPEGRTVHHEGDAKVESLIARAAGETDAISLGELERQMAAGGSQPMTPGPVQGIGPGGPIRMHKADADGQLGTYICSASYLFRNATTGTFYLATAGHCLLDEGVETSEGNEGARARWVQICYADCVNNYVGIGKYVELAPDDAYPGYHPVAWAEQKGIGQDFGFIEIPSSMTSLLRPSLWMWGGPTGFKRPALGTPLVHYGFGVGLGQATPTQGRMAVTILSSKEEGHGAVGWVNGGDSGSAFGTAAVRADEMLLGDGASGAITHAIVGVGLPLMWGTDIENALDHSEAALGSRLQLVNEDWTTAESPSQGSPSGGSNPSPGPSPSPSGNPSPTPTPSPSSSPTPEPGPSPEPSPEPTDPENDQPIDREVSLRSSRSVVEDGDLVRLRGSISSSFECAADQGVNVLARSPRRKAFHKVDQATTDNDGDFVVVLRPHRTRVYRVVIPADEGCAEGLSRAVTIKVAR